MLPAAVQVKRQQPYPVAVGLSTLSGTEQSQQELEAHIASCAALWQAAYARFQQHQLPADREEALLWLHEQNQAILRRPGMQAFLGTPRQEAH
jgi:hypothetical protein